MTRAAGVLLIVLLSAMSAHAQDAPSSETQIDLSYDATDVRIRPSPGGGTVHHSLHIVLSGNRVSETNNSRATSGKTQDVLHNSQLGEEVVHTNSSATWHVLGAKSLARTRVLPQSVETIKVNVLPDKQCTLSVTNRLKPGYKEYAMNSINVGGMAYYSSWQASNELCAIR